MHFFGGYDAGIGAPPGSHNPESYYDIIQDKCPSGRSGTATLEIALTKDNGWDMAEASLYYITPYKCTGNIEVSAWVRFEPYDPPGYPKGLCFNAYEKDEAKAGVANYIEYGGFPGTIDGTGFCTMFVVMEKIIVSEVEISYWEIPNVGNIKKIDDPEEDLDWADSTWYFTRYTIDMQTRSASVYIYEEDGTTLLGKLEDISIPTGTRGDPITHEITYEGDASYYDLYGTQLFGFGGGKTGVAYFNGISVSGDIDPGTLQMTLGETDFDEQIIDWEGIVYKAIDESVTSSTTFQDDDDLKFSMAADGIYQFEFIIFYKQSVNPDSKWQLATENNNWQFCIGGGLQTCADDLNKYTGFKLGAANVTGNINDINYGSTNCDPAIEIIRGTVQCNAGVADTFKLQWAQRASSATALTVYKGSYVKWRRIS